PNFTQTNFRFVTAFVQTYKPYRASLSPLRSKAHACDINVCSNNGSFVFFCAANVLRTDSEYRMTISGSRCSATKSTAVRIRLNHSLQVGAFIWKNVLAGFSGAGSA
ncbi:hypothetical protein Bhyg_10936, partial [Pseudolycoriella hygida]